MADTKTEAKGWQVPYKDDEVDGTRLFEARICYAVTAGFYAIGITPEQAFETLRNMYVGKDKAQLKKHTRIVVLPPGITHHGFDGHGVRWLGAKGAAVRFLWNGKMWTED